MSAEKKKNVRHVLFMPCTAPSVRTGDLLNEHGQTHRLKSTETIISAIDLLFAERRTFKKIFGTCFGFEKKKKLANAAFTKKKKLFKKKKTAVAIAQIAPGSRDPAGMCSGIYTNTPAPSRGRRKAFHDGKTTKCVRFFRGIFSNEFGAPKRARQD
jgi:hypothetical protein